MTSDSNWREADFAGGAFPFPPFYDCDELPGDAVEGTREFPFTACAATAACFMHKRVLCSHAQHVAKIRLAAGLAVDWDVWAYTLARLRQCARPAGINPKSGKSRSAGPS